MPKIKDWIDNIFSHNEIIALWETLYDDDLSYHSLIWRGEAWRLPEEYKSYEAINIFGTIPETIIKADTINIEVEREHE